MSYDRFSYLDTEECTCHKCIPSAWESDGYHVVVPYDDVADLYGASDDSPDYFGEMLAKWDSNEAPVDLFNRDAMDSCGEAVYWYKEARQYDHSSSSSRRTRKFLKDTAHRIERRASKQMCGVE